MSRYSEVEFMLVDFYRSNSHPPMTHVTANGVKTLCGKRCTGEGWAEPINMSPLWRPSDIGECQTCGSKIIKIRSGG